MNDAMVALVIEAECLWERRAARRRYDARRLAEIEGMLRRAGAL